MLGCPMGSGLCCHVHSSMYSRADLDQMDLWSPALPSHTAVAIPSLLTHLPLQDHCRLFLKPTPRSYSTIMLLD